MQEGERDGQAVTKSGTGTWGLGLRLGDLGPEDVGLRDLGAWGRWTWGHWTWDAGTWDAGTQGREDVGTLGCRDVRELADMFKDFIN